MEPVVLLFAGDSITDADHLWDPGPLGLGNGYVNGIGQVLTDKQIINSGFNGFRAIDLHRRFDRVCLEKEPDLVTLLVGVNEAGAAAEGMVTSPEDFRATYAAMIEAVKEKGAAMILMEPFLFSKPAYLISWRPYFDSIRRVIREVADSYGLPLILLDEDLNRMAKELGADAVTIDGIHLTKLGNQYLTERWLACYKELSGSDSDI